MIRSRYRPPRTACHPARMLVLVGGRGQPHAWAKDVGQFVETLVRCDCHAGVNVVRQFADTVQNIAPSVRRILSANNKHHRINMLYRYNFGNQNAHNMVLRKSRSGEPTCETFSKPPECLSSVAAATGRWDGRFGWEDPRTEFVLIAASSGCLMKTLCAGTVPTVTTSMNSSAERARSEPLTVIAKSPSYPNRTLLSSGRNPN